MLRRSYTLLHGVLQDLIKYGYPYFDRFQTLKDAYELALEGKRLGKNSLPIAHDRASVAMTIAKVEGYPDLKSEYERQLRFLRSHGVVQRKGFVKYCSEVLGLAWIWRR